MKPEAFEVAFPQGDLEDLWRRVRATRWADDFANDDWAYGVNRAYLRELVDYWLDDYDWRAQERAINEFTHYKVWIDDVPVHFIREPGTGPKPMPIVMTHGWPWSFWDYHKIIKPLADPASHGGDPEDAFEVIVASMPGFTFSSPLTKPGINAWRVADIWQKLMTEVLGFTRYAAQGGDWGAATTMELGHKFPDSIIGLHLTSVPRSGYWNNERPWDVTAGNKVPDSLSREEREHALDIQHRIASHVAVHMLEPQTLAYALQDSPVGMLAWLVIRRRNWSDSHGDVESRFSKDFLLTSTMLYWLTGSFNTSARLYAEAGKDTWTPTHNSDPLVPVPTGITYLEKDVGRGLGSDAEKQFNVIYKNEHPVGGHFAPMEEPEVVIDDIRATFRGLRG